MTTNNITSHYCKVPNELARSKKLTPKEKLILILILGCGDNGFPSYKLLREWSGLSVDTIWRCLRRLEASNLIIRYKNGKSIVYATYWQKPENDPKGLIRIHFNVSDSQNNVSDGRNECF